MRVSSRLSAVAFFSAALLLSTSLAAGCADPDPKDNGPGAGGSIPEPECHTSADCDAPLSHCGPRGTCVACLDTEHCETGFCDELNRCVFCLEDDHCEGGVCNPDGHCVGCVSGEDCASGHCLDNECLPEGMCTATIECAEGYRCISYATGATRGICEAECDVFAEEPCVEGFLCRLRGFDDDGAPLATCVEPNGGAQEQESCRSEEVSCEQNLLCVARTSVDVRCNTLCDVDSEEPGCAEGSTCEEVTFQSGDTIGACIADKVPCSRNDDCPDGERCSITAGGEMICIQAVGPKEGGDACTSGLECDAGLCLNDFCFGACSGSEGCFEGGACIHRFLTNGQGMFWFLPVCVPTCSNQADCEETEVCRYESTSSKPPSYVGTCSTAIGTLTSGQDCSASNECRSGVCLARPAGYCSGMCETEEDCGPRTTCTDTLVRLGAGDDGRLNTEDDVVDVQRVCTPEACVNDTECPGDWVCKPEVSLGWSSAATLTLRCGPKVGALPAGAVCEIDGNCETGKCLKSQDPEASPFCFGACEVADAECLEGLRCVQGAAQIPYGLEQIASWAACIE